MFSCHGLHQWFDDFKTLLGILSVKTLKWSCCNPYLQGGFFALHVFFCSNSSKRMECYQVSADLHDKLILWNRSAGRGTRLKHAGHEILSTMICCRSKILHLNHPQFKLVTWETKWVAVDGVTLNTEFCQIQLPRQFSKNLYFIQRKDVCSLFL